MDYVENIPLVVELASKRTTVGVISGGRGLRLSAKKQEMQTYTIADSERWSSDGISVRDGHQTASWLFVSKLTTEHRINSFRKYQRQVRFRGMV